jgi:hypothetical protein
LKQNSTKCNDLLIFTNKIEFGSFNSSFFNSLNEPLLIKNENFKLALKNIYYGNIIKGCIKLNIYGFSNLIDIPELLINKLSNLLNIILKLSKSSSNIDQKLIDYEFELEKSYNIIIGIKLKPLNNSQLIKAYVYLKQLTSYISWKKFDEISSEKFKKINIKFIEKFKLVINDYVNLLTLIKDFELLDTITLIIDKNMTFALFEELINEKFSKYATLLPKSNEFIKIQFSEFIFKFEIQSNININVIEINNNYKEKALELIINFPKKKSSKYLKVYCDAIYNKHTNNDSNLLKRFKINDSLVESFDKLNFIQLNKTRINTIEFIIKNENNELVTFEPGEIVFELELKEF